MTNSKNTYYNEDTRRVHDDCVEGDTVSEGDTSDEEDIAASKTKRSTRKSSSLSTKEGLQIPSGRADDSDRPRANRRKSVYVALAFAVVVVTSAAIGGGIYAAKKNLKVASSTSTTLEEEFATSSSIPISSRPSAVATSSESEDENDIVQEPSNIVQENYNDKDSESKIIAEDNTLGRIDDFESNILPNDNTLGLLEEMVDYEDEKKSEFEDEQEKGSTQDKDTQPTNWPDLVGITGDQAKAKLELLFGEDAYEIKVLHEDSPTTRDYRFNRIRIFTNYEGIVTKVPRIG